MPEWVLVPLRVLMPLGLPTPPAGGFSGGVASRLIGALVRRERPTLLYASVSAFAIAVLLGAQAPGHYHEVVERVRVGKRLHARRLRGSGAHQDALDRQL